MNKYLRGREKREYHVTRAVGDEMSHTSMYNRDRIEIIYVIENQKVIYIIASQRN